MNRIIASILCLVLFAVFVSAQAKAQQDKQVQTKQTDLKKEYNDYQEKNQIIKAAAKDKPAPTKDRRRKSITTGYDYTQVKGFQLKSGSLQERLDKLFKKASDFSYLEEEYHLNGAATVPCPNGQGGAQITGIEIYLVEATQEEMEKQGINQYDLMEIRIVKLETCPEAAKAEDEGTDEEDGRRRRSTGLSTSMKSYSLSGQDLWSMVKFDEGIYDDLLARRTTDPAINLPSDLFLPSKRGPFVVMNDKELETNTSRFYDFWNQKDTVNLAKEPETAAAAGPFTTANVPLMFPSETKIRITNPNNAPLTIKNASFQGSHADMFVVKTKVPMMLGAKGTPESKQDIAFDYIGESPYEMRSTLFLDAPEAKLSQGIDIVANPGKYPSDFVVLHASLDKLELRSPSRSDFAPDWRLTYTIGTDQINLPRWASGLSSLSVGYKHQMAIGLVMPMRFNASSMPSPLGYETNLFASPMGYDVQFDFTFGFPFSLGGYLAFMNKFNGEEAYKNMKVLSGPGALIDEKNYTNDFFHIVSIAQIYYPIMFTDRQENPNVAFRLNIGGGYYQVERNHLVGKGDLSKPEFERVWTAADEGKLFSLGKEKDVMDVYVRISFINMAAKNTYGIGMQYFGGRMMADAFLELTNWLRVEMKYSFLLREKEVYETENSYFMLTPRFRFGLPSIFK